MASVEMIEEETATGKAKEIYDDIKESLGIDFVPNMYKTMARNPAYLEASWRCREGFVSCRGHQWQQRFRTVSVNSPFSA